MAPDSAGGRLPRSPMCPPTDRRCRFVRGRRFNPRHTIARASADTAATPEPRGVCRSRSVVNLMVRLLGPRFYSCEPAPLRRIARSAIGPEGLTRSMQGRSRCAIVLGRATADSRTIQGRQKRCLMAKYFISASYSDEGARGCARTVAPSASMSPAWRSRAWAASSRRSTFRSARRTLS
jgi:hypothetical protein